MRKILFITGTRADFGKLKTIMEKVEASEDFECFIFATGMHTLSRYGYTINEIKKCNFQNIFPYMNQTENNSSDMDIVLAKTVTGFGYYVRELKPDMIVVHGDRVEALAAAIVGTLNNILVAHIEGGEISGTIDEIIRHSITKLAHIHFVSNSEAYQRLIQMGEIPTSIFEIGSPNIDIMLSDKLPTLSEAKNRYGIDFERYALFCYHPVTTELQIARKNIYEILDALIESKLKFIVISPNNDSGCDIISEAIHTLKDNPSFKIFPSVRFEYYLTLLKYSDFILGNSSSGIHEAPVYGVPTINIGSRQKNRFVYPSIINVPEKKEIILDKLATIPSRFEPTLHFGKGGSDDLFMGILKGDKLWSIPCQKQFKDAFISRST